MSTRKVSVKKVSTRKINNKRKFERLTEGTYEGLSIYRNIHSKFQPSYVAYPKDDKTRAFNISGFPARQLADLRIEEMPNYTFDIEVETRFSGQYQKDYLVMTRIFKHKHIETIQKKLEIEGED